MENNTLRLTVSGLIATINQTFEYAYPSVEVEGEVASFKVNQGKYVFFDIKDSDGSLNCFMTVWQLRMPIEDGMKVIVTAVPKITQWGKFSLTIKAIRPSGEGSIRKSFEILKAKLEKEGLFAPERKRPLPALPHRIAVISSVQAAGYADFIKILNDRWGGMQVDVASVQVQGAAAADQLIRALKYFNSRQEIPEVIVIIRGGGSADDLSTFNDELLAREIASSRIPTLVGVGHEIDVSLADMVADVRAATPSNAAQILVPDKEEIRRSVRQQMKSLLPRMEQSHDVLMQGVHSSLMGILDRIDSRFEAQIESLHGTKQLLHQINPRTVLQRGYALVRGRAEVGDQIEIEEYDRIIRAEVKDVTNR